MLKQLYINNFALIDKSDIRFYPGFSVITGETGAGKSIILGAIGLLLGQRADTKLIKAGSSKCIIEAHFDISRYDMEGFFTENDIDYDADDCIIRRELTASGKSRGFINDVPVQLTLMRELGEKLVDIHSQHQNLLLGEEDFQMSVVDIIAGNKDIHSRYLETYLRYKDAAKAVEKLKEETEKNKLDEDFLRFQQKELQDAYLKEGLQEELEAESEKLNHAEDIKTALYECDNLLEGETGAVDMVRDAAASLSRISNVFPEVSEMAERLDACHIELKDIARDAGAKVSDVEYDPARTEEVNSKLDNIYSLEQKFRVNSVEELINILSEIDEKLSHIDNGDEELAELEKKRDELHDEAVKAASTLSETRKKAGKKVEKEMQRLLVPLGMPNIRFEVTFEGCELNENGADKASFMFSANKNTPLMPVSKVASGGEIARVMLSLKAMISGAVKLPTIIFDEIDTGVSGQTAEKMAMIMSEMGHNNRQVISITHLPQIAAAGANHYKVYKCDTAAGTESKMTILDFDQRVEEIAKMLSGSNVTDAAISNAKELLKRTDK